MRDYIQGSVCISLFTSLAAHLILPTILRTVRSCRKTRVQKRRRKALPRYPSLPYHFFPFLSSAFVVHVKLVSIHYHNTSISRCF
ncbi:hypothetical protein EV421DRAFT_1804925 [Armillaria borealis]|uniref:Uncharacterized protein n=1 Tax=Armillaria borealis TaxID=47425 RepID=A0AA39JIY2_9AGAR|nr:hypothetical protein EV421DRAFT_1804925 [Armillaria borealis]